MQQEWNIKSRSEVCSNTGRPFKEGEIFYTALFREGDEFRRADLSEEAWKALSADPAAEPVFSSWRSKFELPAPPPPETLRRDDAEGMLRRLVDSHEPAHRNTRYLLAVMLERKRILRPQPTSEKGLLVYEHTVTGETFIITDPNLSLSDLVAVQAEVSALLAGLSMAPKSPTGEETPLPASGAV